jgi:hypothetical protein
VLHLGRFQPYPLKLEQTGKACQGQTLQLIAKIRKLWTKKFKTLASVDIEFGNYIWWQQSLKSFLLVIVDPDKKS